MTAVTFSYKRRSKRRRSHIAHGGFEPYLSLFDAPVNFLASMYFGTTCPPSSCTNPDGLHSWT
jgi:hypothetical protein